MHRSYLGLFLLTCCLSAMEIPEEQIIPSKNEARRTPGKKSFWGNLPLLMGLSKPSNDIRSLLTHRLKQKLCWLTTQHFDKTNGVIRTYKKMHSAMVQGSEKKNLKALDWDTYHEIQHHLENNDLYLMYKKTAQELSSELDKKPYDQRLSMCVKKHWDLFYENALYLMEDLTVKKSSIAYPAHFLSNGTEKNINIFAQEFLERNKSIEPNSNDGTRLITIMLVCCYLEYIQEGTLTYSHH